VKRDEVYLKHILDAINRIIAYTEDGKGAFLGNTMMQDAVIRNLEVTGEATKALSKQTHATHQNISWDDMAGMRYGIDSFWG